MHRWWVNTLFYFVYLFSSSAKNDSLVNLGQVLYGCGGWGYDKNNWALTTLTWALTIWTPCLSARKRYTKRVARITEVIGAIAGTQKYFLFFFPCGYETSLSGHTLPKNINIKAKLSGKKKDAHNVLRKEKKSKEYEANHNCLPVPLHIQNHALSDNYRSQYDSKIFLHTVLSSR